MKSFLHKIFIISVAIVFIQMSDAQAKKKGIFDDRYSYDIYFSTGYKLTSVLESVDIVGFEEIAGKTFLVVETSNFSLQDSNGYILFDSVTAIVPDRNFKVKNVDKLRLHHHTK